jgi:glycosyltransferase involved in cell wall biosynthesis
VVQLVTLEDVSVVIPIRNGMQFAPKFLRKLLTDANGIEVVIIDDGSTDGSFEFCNAFCSENSDLKVFRNPSRGISEALNYGILKSKGKWIARFDIDDQYHIQRIEEQINIVNKTHCDIVFSDYSFYANGILKMGSLASAVLSDPVKLSLISGRRTPHPVAFFRKELYERVGGYLTEDSPAEDLSLWLRMHSLGTFASSPIELLRYRLASSSVTIQNRSLSVLKRKQLLQRYPIGIDVFDRSINNLEKTIDAYNLLEKGSERLILHLLDLIQYKNTYNAKMPTRIKLLVLRKFLSLSGALSVIRLLFNGFRRYYFRKNLEFRVIERKGTRQ